MSIKQLMSSVASLAIVTVVTTAPAAAQGQAAGQNVVGLEEVIVTAQRREESLQRAATAVDVIDASDIVRSNLSSQTQLGQLVPALSIQGSGGANTTVFVRGVGNFTVNGYSDPAVAFNYDGVYVGRPTSTSGYFFDLERIEVLKGPQGTLYGRNATGGAINILPARPQLNELGGMTIGSVGNYDTYSLQAAVNLPIGASTAVRVAGNFINHSGYLSDGTSNERARAARIQLLHEATPDLTIRLAADYSHAGGTGLGTSHANTGFFNVATGSYDDVPSGFSRATGVYDPQVQAYRQALLYSGQAGRFLGPIEEKQYQDNDYYGVNAEIVLNTEIGAFTLIPAYRRSEVDNVHAAPGYAAWPQEDDDQTSVEARYNSERFGPFDLIAGLYYFHEKIDGNYTFGIQTVSAFQDFTNKTNSYAGFARLTAHLSDSLRLSGGLRYTQDKKSINGGQDAVIVVCTAPPFPIPACPGAPMLPLTDSPEELPIAVPAPNGPPLPLGTTGAIVLRSTGLTSDSVTKNRITYRAGVEYDVGPSALLYASYETGYRSGGFALAVGHETFRPEYIDAYTLGSKNRFFDDRVQLNVEAFYWKYKNQQVSHAGIGDNGAQSFWTDNVGKSTNKGIEAELQLLATANTLLSADVQYLDTQFKSYVYQVPALFAPPYTGCAFALNPANPTQYDVDCSGRPAYNSPKWTVNLGAQQTIPLGGYKLVVAADTQYKTSRWVGFGYWDFSHVDSTWRTNASVTLAQSDERWSLSAFVDNIENDRIVTTANVNEAVTGGYVMTTPPRTYGLRAAVKF